MKKKKTGYYVDCILHGRRCHKKICKRCGMHYCDEFYTDECPGLEADTGKPYHPAKDQRDLPMT
jgi:hypothetical protein